MAVESIPATDAPTTVAPHRILITFASDQELDGMKVEIMDVTPEQCAVASYHLMRSANQLSDAAMLNAARERGEIKRIRRELSGGKMS